MRRALAETLCQAAESDPRVVFLTGDLGFGTFDEFCARFGPRYVNVGVAEAQLVCAAAGLALEGFRPVIYSIGSFMTGRPFEQIRISIDYANLPVVIVGAGGGYTYASSGVTHHSGEDLALMGLLPNMTVVAPGDPGEFRQLFPQLLQLNGPSYIRVGKYGEPAYSAPEDAVLGRARLLRDGRNLAILTTGGVAVEALQAADRLAAEGAGPLVYQMHTIKPLDTATLDRIGARVDTLVVVEEHLPVGGLAAAVYAWQATRRVAPRVVRLGPPHSLLLGSPSQQEVRRRLGYDADAIYETCRQVIRERVPHE
jgi:transketolase